MRVPGLFELARESRSAVGAPGMFTDPAAIPPNSSLLRSAAGVVVSETTAMQLAAVYACVQVIADAISTMPLDAYRRTSDGRRVPVLPAPLCIADPFTDLELVDGIAQVLVSLLLRGNAYMVVTARDFYGVPTGFEIVHPDQVQPKMVAGRMTYQVNRQPVATVDMVHIRGLLTPGSRVGLSPIEYASQTIGIGIAAEDYGASFYAEGAHPGGVLSTDQHLSSEQAKRIAQTLMVRHGGLANAHHPLVLEGGLKWQPITVPPEQAQFLATRQYTKQDIGMLFGVPPHLIGDVDRTTSWGKGIEQQGIQFVTYTLRRWLYRLESAFTRMLPRGQYVRANVDALLRADTITRYQSYMVARTAGFLSNNEIRELEDRPPIPGSDGSDFTAPLNSAHTDVPGVGTPGNDDQGAVAAGTE